jgi:hemerythrin superfamily protein
MDAITLLKNDHRTVEKLFKRFEKAGEGAHATKREVVEHIVEELSVHAAIEEQFFYPVTRATVPGIAAIALESLEEHHIVKWVLSELDSMTPADERFEAKVTVLMENVRHHVDEEEKDFFPKVRQALGRKALNDLGSAMDAAKKVAPTHPHPKAPDTPPGNLLAGTASGVADRVGDTVGGLAQGSVTAVADLIATVLHRQKARVSPTGSPASRKTAAKVRTESAHATEAAIDAARRSTRQAEAATKTTARRTRRASSAAKKGTTSTPRAAKSGASRTATSARTSAKRTTATAKRAVTKTVGAGTAAARRTATSAAGAPRGTRAVKH